MIPNFVFMICFIFLVVAVGNAKDAAKSAKAMKASDADTVKLVQLFLKTLTADLNPELIPEFISVDRDSLPKSLQGPYQAKKEELLALKKVADGRKKPSVRRRDMSAPRPANCAADPLNSLGVLKMAGYAELTEDDVAWLERKIKCNECELMVEFTLRKVEKVAPKSRKKTKAEFIYLLHIKDVLWNLVGVHRQGIENPFGSQLFGEGPPSCH